VVASDRHIGARHKAEATAIEYLWPHSNDWNGTSTQKEGSGLRRRQGSTLTTCRAGPTSTAGRPVLGECRACRTEIGAAMAEQAGRLAYTASSNSTNPATVALAETIASITPGDLDRVFFCSGDRRRWRPR